MESRKILVASGDFELIQQSKQALSDLGFTLHGAYSHRDAQFAVKNSNFDAIIAHGHMRDRQTNEPTMHYLATQRSDTPLIIYLPDIPTETNGANGDLPSRYVVTTTDDASIRHIVLQALHHFTAPLRDTAVLAVLKGRDDAEYWDVDEVQTLLALTRSLTEILDLNEVLNRVVEAARQLTGAEEGMILLPDGDSPQLYLRSKVGMDVTTARNFRVKTDDSVAGQVFRTGQPITIGARGPTKVKTEYFVNALLYVPILFKGQPIGVLGVNNRVQQDVFNSHHEALLLNLAAYAAIAIENARVHGQSVRRARELKALVDASQAINASLALDHTLPTICEQITRALGINQAEIYDWDREQGILRSRSRFCQTVWRPGHEPLLGFADYPRLRFAVQEHRPVYVRASKTDSPAEQHYMRRLGSQAMLIVPIMAQEQVFGAVLAHYLRSPSQMPSNEAVQSAQHLALQALVEHVDRGRKLTSNVLSLADQVKTLLGADWCEYGLIALSEDAVSLHVAVGKVAWLDSKKGVTVALSRYPDLVEALDTQNLLNQQVDGDTVTPGAQALLQTTRGRALLGLPLLYRGQTQGLVLCIDTESSRLFSAREVDLARTIVGQASTALENARLIHDLEDSLEQLQRAQARLIQAERLSAMGELAGAVAHQINNPLTTIVMDTELLLLHEDQASERYETLNAIMRSGKRAGAVVRRLLTALRPQSGDKEKPEEIQVITTIEDTLSLVKSHIERDKIRLIAQMPTGQLPPVLAVRGELDDVWLNLVLNAHDALIGRPDALIVVSAQHDIPGECIRVMVADNGPGIPDDIRPMIFEPFYTTKPVGEGTGLGLHICRQVIQRVGGSIAVESSAGEGTRFIVTLPIQKGN